MSDDPFEAIVIIFVVFALVFVGFCFGMGLAGTKTEHICEYLKAEKQGSVCIKDGAVVYEGDNS